jgi:predicted permease
MPMVLRLALRRLAQAPGFTAFSIATLALGIGVTSAIYSALLGLTQRAVGVRNPDGIVTVRQLTATDATRSGPAMTDFSGPEYVELRDGQSAFSDLAAVTRFGTSLSADGRAELVRGEAVSGNFFQTLGVRPALGRLLQPADDRPDAPPVLVLADATWRRQFNRDPAIVGRSVRLGGRPFAIVGVTPRGFNGAESDWSSERVWAPLAVAPAGRGREFRLDLTSREARDLKVVGRLAAGVTPDAAAARIQPLVRQMDRLAPRDRSPQYRPPHPLVASAFDPPGSRASASDSLLITLALPALVLLVACTNLANLALSRNASRRHEFAVRRALGASRWRVVGEQLVEGAIVSIAGGLAGCFVAAELLAYLGRLTQDLRGTQLSAVSIAPAMDASVFVAAAGFALLAFLIASLSPAVQLTRTSDRTMLSSDTGAGVAPRWRGRSNLIALQVWVSVCLFLLTALGVRMILDEHRVGRSAALEGDVVQVDLPFDAQKRDEAASRQIADRIVRDLQARSAIDGAALRTRTGGFNMMLTPTDRPFVPKINEGQHERLVLMSPDAFRLMGVSMRFGRRFDDRDHGGQAPAIVVNESLARALFGRVDAAGAMVLGRSFDLGAWTWVTKTYQIVGVSADTFSRGRVDDVIYAPVTQHYFGGMSILARGRGLDLDETLTVVRTAIRQADPDLAVGFAGRADPERWLQAAIARFMTSGAAAIAALTLILAMTGLYGVLSHVVSRRTRELGVRMALGADRGRIVALVLRNGFRPVLEGLVLGSISAIILNFMLQPLLTNPVAGFDPLLVALAAGPLLVAASLACYLPARRASRVEPNVALRDL